MENKNLLIVFVKNPVSGKVKTRLAKTIGNENAFLVYHELLRITENATRQLKNCHVQVYFSENREEDTWQGCEKFIQQGNDLGEKMQFAFEQGFTLGFKNIVLIGSDLPEISSDIIQKAFDALKANDIVFGPSEDGGYYLVGMKVLHHEIFKNKPWSTPNLLEVTLKQLEGHKSVCCLTELNDIDEYEDLITHTEFLQLIKGLKFMLII